MKLSMLNRIIINHAHQLEEDAGYSGSYTDGGSANLLQRLSDYKNRFVVKLDLRPSEFNKLDDIEVGEPLEFSEAIQSYKMKLVRDIKL